MKATNLLITFCILSSSSYHLIAQDNFKPVAGSWSTELNVNLFQGELKLNNAINQIKVRRYLNNGMTIRSAFDFSSSILEDKAENNYGTNPYRINSVRKKTIAGFSLGVEKHFTGTRRLSPYLGTELAYTLKKVSQVIESDDRTIEVQGSSMTTFNPNPYYFPGSSSYLGDKGYTSVDMNLIAGFDFYFAEKIYFGYEILFGFGYMKNPTITISETTLTGDFVNTYPDIDGSEFHAGPEILNGIRLGFIF
jgi:hypothetical protein